MPLPEWVVQHVDQHWMTGYPSAEEAYLYPTSRGYVRWLLTHQGTGDGKALELLGGVSVERHARVPRLAAATELFDGLRRRLHAGGA